MAEWPHGGSLFPSNSHLGVSLSIPGLLRCSLWDIGWYIEIYKGYISHRWPGCDGLQW